MSSQRVNLWSSPNFKNTSFWGSASRSVDDDGWLTVTPVKDNDIAIGTAVHLEPSTKYVWSVEISTPVSTPVSATSPVLMVYTEHTIELLQSCTTANGRGQCRFTTRDTVGIYELWMFGVASGIARKFRNPLLELASTYDAAVRGGKTYPVVFTGDTRPE